MLAHWLLLGAALLFAPPANSDLQISRRVLEGVAQESLPRQPEICSRFLSERAEHFTRLKGELEKLNRRQLEDGWQALGDACRVLAIGGQGDPVLVAERRWLDGQELLRKAINIPASAPSAEEDSGPSKISKCVRRGLGKAICRFPRDQVWDALIESLTDAHVEPQNLEKDSGVIFLQTGTNWGNNWGDANQAVKMLTTKEVKWGSTWQAITARGNIYCKSLDERLTEVRVNLSYQGCNGWQAAGSGYPCLWEGLESNGYAERLIFEGVAERLPEVIPSEQLAVVAGGDAGVADRARQALTALHEIGAAYEMEATRDDLLARLIDARVAVDDFEASDGGELLPLFIETLGDSIALYRRAIDAGPERAELMAQAKRGVRAAAQYLANFRRYGQEPPPENE